MPNLQFAGWTPGGLEPPAENGVDAGPDPDNRSCTQPFAKFTKMLLHGLVPRPWPSVSCRVTLALLAVVLFLLPIISNAGTTDGNVQSMALLWSHATPPNFQVRDIVWLSQKQIALLGRDERTNQALLLLGLGTNDTERLVPLNVKGGSHIVGNGKDTLWIGGAINYRTTLTDIRLSDAYLGRLDRDGNVVWRREFSGSHGRRSIQSLMVLPGGEVIAVGQFGMRNWLARISADGKIVWENIFGLGKAASVSVLRDKIVVAAFNADNIDYPLAIENERISVFVFEMSGQLIDEHVIRTNIGNNFRQNVQNTFIKIIVSPIKDSIYLFAAWSESRSATPLEVVKLNALGDVLWRKELPDTVYRPGPPKGIAPFTSMYDVMYLCPPHMAVLSSGVPVLNACGSAQAFVFVQLSSKAGNVTRTSVLRPVSATCDASLHSNIESMAQKDDDHILVVGSGTGCVWLGETVLPKIIE